MAQFSPEMPMYLEAPRGALPSYGPSRPVPLLNEGDQRGPGSTTIVGRHGTGRPPVLTATPDLFALLRALQHHWKLAISLGMLCAIIATIAAWYLAPQPKYKASVLLQVSTLPAKFLLETSDPKPDFKI